MSMASALLFLFISPCFAAPAPELISRAVGEVKDHIVTSREVQVSSMVEDAMYSTQKNSKEIKSPSPELAMFRKDIASTLLEWVVSLESSNFNVANVSKNEVEDAVRSVQVRLAGNGSWLKLQVAPVELAGVVERKMRAKKFIRFKADSSVVPITDTEAKKYFEDNRLKFGDLPFENFKENIKTFLGRQQVEKRLKDWFDVLQSKYKVKNYQSEF